MSCRPRPMQLKLPVLFALIWLVTLLAGCASAPAAPQPPLTVFYAGPANDRQGVMTALKIAADTRAMTLVDSPAQADVFVLNGQAPQPDLIAERVKAGAGLVLIAGPDLAPTAVSTLLGAPATWETRTEDISLVNAVGAHDALLTDIIWNSAPQIHNRVVIQGTSLRPLITGFTDQSLVLGSGEVGRGQVFVVTAFLDDTSNPQIQEWGYFNYLIYHLALRAGRVTPATYGDYAGAPIPQPQIRYILVALMAGLVVMSFVAFFLVRRYSRAHPELLDMMVVDRAEFETRQANTQWEEIGFHRPLSGFLWALMVGFIFFIPLILYQNLVLPVYILPSAQALGLWGRVSEFFQFLWPLFDMGTGIASIKFFSQYRLSNPRRAVLFPQIFVWFQILTGAINIATIVILSSVVLPHTEYALYAWAVIVTVLNQLPGFYPLMVNMLTANQRFDYAQILDMGKNLLFPMLAQPLCVLLMVYWGQHNPIYGGAMGGLIGLGLASYVVAATQFFIGLYLYRRLGLNLGVFFYAHFDWGAIKEAFRFGVFEMLSSTSAGIVGAVEVLATQTRLVNYGEVWGNWSMASSFAAGFGVLSTLVSNVMPSISESLSNSKRLLSQYYASMAYKWGGLISGQIAAILLAVADRFILGASGPDFARAAVLVVPVVIGSSISHLSWVGENVELGANKPYLKWGMIVLESTLRLTLMFVLLAKFQVFGLIAAIYIAALTRGIATYFVNDRFCFKQHYYFWQSAIAPLLAATLHYLVLRGVTGLIWQNDQVTSIIILFVGILLSYPVYAFFYGLVGGWDDATLDEFHQAVDLTNIMRPFLWLYWKSTSLGARISPLHGRFPISNRAAAMAEAEELMQARAPLAQGEPVSVDAG